MSTLDTSTLLFASVSSRGAYAAIFFVSMLSRRGERHLAHWGTSILLSMAALAMTYSSEEYPFLPPAKGSLVYGTYAASLTVCWSGLRLFNGRRPSLVVSGLHVVGTGASYGVLGLAVSDSRVAMAAMFLCLSCVMAQVIHELWRAPDHGRLASRYIVGTALAAFLLLFVASMIMTAIDPAIVADPANTYSSLIADQTLSILIYIGLLAMAGERAYTRLERQALTDPLTGIANRRGLGLLVQPPRRSKIGASPACVVMWDIDHFKTINDRHGHEAGDAVLTEFAARLSTAFRCRSGAMARWGGEEFVAILKDTPLEEATRLAERFRRTVEAEPFTIGPTSIRVTVSAGVAALAAGEGSIDPAIRRADAVLYAAKNGGRNRVRTDDGSIFSVVEKAA